MKARRKEELVPGCKQPCWRPSSWMVLSLLCSLWRTESEHTFRGRGARLLADRPSLVSPPNQSSAETMQRPCLLYVLIYS